jgi:hypothetical protein
VGTAVDYGLAIIGFALVVIVLDAAIRTFVIPRGSPVLFTTMVFRPMRSLFDAIANRADEWEGVDRVMAGYAPVTLLLLPFVWLVTVFVGFACIFHAVEHIDWAEAFVTSGSSLLTLGFERPDGGVAVGLAFVEAIVGLALLALLIAYLPTIYNTFSRRELAVTQLAVRAGTPPTGVELIERAHRAGYLDRLDQLFEQWELWFVELGETHTSLPVLTFFRSPNPHRSWITASGAVLDAAALRYAVLDVPWTPAPGVCVRAGYLALREIADFYGMSYTPDPRPDDPIAVTRDEFDEVYERLAAGGLPLTPDRDRAWADFAGWRVNYDTVLLKLAGLVNAPFAPWSSDRSAPWHPSVLRGRRARRGDRR